MKTNGTIISWLAALAVASTASAQTFTLLHSFTSDGAYPQGSLIQSNGTLYGMGDGGIFKMNINGSGFTSLHYWSIYGGNGDNPHAALTLSGTNLYGMTVEGGAGVGVAFRVSTNGIGYTALHYFNSRETNGASPYGSLTLANGTFYGTTSQGGTNNLGTLFRMNMDGSAYTNLHAFAGGSADGAYPMGDLLLSGTNFYGMTSQGGTNNLGTVFRVNTNGTGYTNLHSFIGYPNDGAGPPGSLTLDGSTLYGMTQEGGPASNNIGAVFKMNTDGSSYTNFHSFAGGTNDGATPYGSLMLSGSTLYGMTYYGGASNKGVVFSLSDLPPAPPPSLTIIYANKHAIISWPSSVSGWTLQTNNNLATGGWGNYTGPIISNTMTNSATKGNLFFRLKQ